MIETLIIKNLFLIEELTLKFEKGFSVFTGETGSGKSALLNAIRLLLGEKADGSFLRKGCESGMALGTFSEFDRTFLQSKGIDIDEGEPLIIQREISVNGKSKAFINQQPVSLSLLKELGKDLIEIADQGASLILRDETLHQKYFDLFGDIDTVKGGKLFEEIQEERKKLSILKARSENKEIEEALLKKEIGDIEANFLDEEEEKQLFEAYTLLSKAHERKDLASQFLNSLPSIKGPQQLLQKLVQLDPSLEPNFKALLNLTLEMSEISHAVDHYLHHIEVSPEKMEAIDEKLSKMSRLKKKYGEGIQSALILSRKRVEELKKLDENIQLLQEELAEKEKECDSFFKGVTKKRGEWKQVFEKQIEEELKSLNIPTARFSVVIEPKERGPTGDETIYFLLAPNLGEKLIRVKDQISGGEMARLLLTLLTLIANKEKKPLIVFDEIDANIGGQTALAIGSKFLQLAASRQVIAITHFPQVAIAANHHFLIHKINQNSRTITTVQKLLQKEIKLELQRMRGE